MMKLAMLGVDRWLELAAAAAARHSDVEISLVCGDAQRHAALLASHPRATLEPDWECLLLARDFDMLLVGTQCDDDALRIEQLRRFVQEGVPLLVVQPAAEAIVLHELGMIQRDTKSALTAWNSVCSHPAAQQIAKALADSDSAAVSHVSIQRKLTDPTWEHVLRQAACDAQWIRQTIGPPDRVTALAPAKDASVLANLSITFLAPSGAMGQWALASGIDDDSFIVESARDRAVWQFARDGSSRLTLDQTEPLTWSADEVARTQGDDILTTAQRALAEPIDESNFDDATRAVELAEAAHESNRRSRTIHLYYEEHSEQQTFKSVMAAGGCLLLLGVLFVLGASIVIDSIGAPVRNNSWWRIWPVCMLAPVVFFLLLQTLWRVFAPPKR